MGLIKKNNRAVSIDELLVFAARKVIECGDECTFERLVYECFTRFPEEFGLRRYPQWPDSTRVTKSWLRCRTDRGWIIGSVKEGFRLTDSGTEVALNLEAKLSPEGKPASESRKVSTRERYDTLLRYIKSSEAFQKYNKSPNSFVISESEFRYVLGCTLQTPIRIIKQNMFSYKNAAKIYDDNDVLNFLNTCEKQMAKFLKRKKM